MSDTTSPLSPIDFQLSEMSQTRDGNQIIHHWMLKCHFRGYNRSTVSQPAIFLPVVPTFVGEMKWICAVTFRLASSDTSTCLQCAQVCVWQRSHNFACAEKAEGPAGEPGGF